MIATLAIINLSPVIIITPFHLTITLLLTIAPQLMLTVETHF